MLNLHKFCNGLHLSSVYNEVICNNVKNCIASLISYSTDNKLIVAADLSVAKQQEFVKHVEYL